MSKTKIKLLVKGGVFWWYSQLRTKKSKQARNRLSQLVSPNFIQ